MDPHPRQAKKDGTRTIPQEKQGQRDATVDFGNKKKNGEDDGGNGKKKRRGRKKKEERPASASRLDGTRKVGVSPKFKAQIK